MRVALGIAIGLIVFAPTASAQGTVHTGVVAYVGQGAQGQGIYVIDADDTSPRRLTKRTPEDPNGPLAWAFGARRLAFADDGLVVVDAASGAATRLTEMADTSPSWDKAGNLWFRREGDLYRMRVGSEPKKVDTLCGDGDGEIAPDGKSFVYTSGTTIFVCSTTTDFPNRPVAQAEPGREVLAPRWSPDGKRIAYFSPSTEADPQSDVLVVDADGTGRTEVGRGGWPDWSPDSRKLVFTETHERSRLFVMRSDGSQRRAIVAGGNITGAAPAWGGSAPAAAPTSNDPGDGGNRPPGGGGDRDTTDSKNGSNDGDGGGNAGGGGGSSEGVAVSGAARSPSAGSSSSDGELPARDGAAGPKAVPPVVSEKPDQRLLIAGLIGGLAMMGAGSGLAFWLLRNRGVT